MVTAETAVVLPALILVLALSLGALRYGIDQVRCLDAARAGARAAARGDSPGAVADVVRRGAPPASEVTVESARGFVTVTVRAAAPPAPLAGLPRPEGVAVAGAEAAAAGSEALGGGSP